MTDGVAPQLRGKSKDARVVSITPDAAQPGARSRSLAALLPQSFYSRDALVVAQELIGQHIHHGEVVLRITEVEAYCHPDDSASHCRMGKTPRNAPMWGP